MSLPAVRRAVIMLLNALPGLCLQHCDCASLPLISGFCCLPAAAGGGRGAPASASPPRAAGGVFVADGAGEDEGCGVRGALWPPQGLCVPFLQLGYWGRAGSRNGAQVWEGAAWVRTSPPPIYLGLMGSPMASSGTRRDGVNPPSLLSILSLRTARQGEKHRGNFSEAKVS